MVGLKDFEMPSCCNSCGQWSFNRDDEPLCDLTYEYIRQFDKRQEDCPLVETYAKADMVAMLTELQLEISELKSYESADGQDLVMLADIGTLFQQKINNLKEDT